MALRSTHLYTVLGFWAFAATAYIAHDKWQDFTEQRLQQAKQAGRDEAITTLLELAEKCQPIDVDGGNQRKVQLTNVACQAGANRPSQPMPQPVP